MIILAFLAMSHLSAQVGFGTANPTAMVEIATEPMGFPALCLKPQTAPSGTENGQIAVIGDKLYMFDSVRSKWLSVEQTTLEFGRLGSGSDPKEIEFGGGDIQGGAKMPMDGTIVCLGMSATKDNSRNINLYINETAVPNDNVNLEVDGVSNLDQTTLKFLNEGFNIDFESGDVIRFEVDNGVNDIENLVVVAYVKWRKDNS